MLKKLLHRQTGRLERCYGYDATYIHEIIDISPGAFLKFGLFQLMSAHRQGVPKETWYAARIAAAICEDCGPCTQLVVDMALHEGMPPRAIGALLRGDIEAAGKDAEFGFRYGIAVAKNTENAHQLAADAAERYGKRALVSLAFAVACSRVYPTLKRGLGHGATCFKIRVANELIAMKAAA